MNRIDRKFSELKRLRKPAFMPFIVAGDPDPRTSLAAAKLLCRSADLLEIGFPYSDPLADGPVIQQADMRALKAGMTTDSVFRLISRVRRFSEIPITVLVYANLVLQRGIENFYRDAARSGVDGVLIPDVPVEEIGVFAKAAAKYKIHQIFLVAQTTDSRRLENILRHARGFLYLVSVLGVTGARQNFGGDTAAFIRRVRGRTSLPLAVGFGISNPAQFTAMVRAGADGAIVGSAIVDMIAQDHKPPFRKLEDLIGRFRPPVKVKICGIKTRAAARAAIDSGADFLGFNFVPSSPRFIPPKAARAIVASLPEEKRPLTVGVFMDPKAVEVRKVLSRVKLDMLQFHGSESPKFCASFREPFIKAFGVATGASVKRLARQMQKYRAAYFLLDRPQQGKGRPIDLRKVEQLAKQFPVMMAGGLTPGNVAVTIKRAPNIQAIDVAGGVEIKGIKKISKIRAFLRSSREIGQSYQ